MVSIILRLVVLTNHPARTRGSSQICGLYLLLLDKLDIFAIIEFYPVLSGYCPLAHSYIRFAGLNKQRSKLISVE